MQTGQRVSFELDLHLNVLLIEPKQIVGQTPNLLQSPELSNGNNARVQRFTINHVNPLATAHNKPPNNRDHGAYANPPNAQKNPSLVSCL